MNQVLGGEEQMIAVARGLWKDVEEVAKKMLAEGKTIAPLLSPDGHGMFHVTTDEAQLSGALMELDVDGTKVYAGLKA